MMLRANNKVEILSPAGSMESVYAGLRCGANAIYMGGKSFSARRNASNFDEDEMSCAVRLIHLYGAKAYLTINTIIFNEEFSSLKSTILKAAEIGFDAFIVQDLGVAHLVRSILPDMPIHASTQMTIYSPQGAILAKEMGISRVVVARELSLNQIREIVVTGIEVEAFVHGALCAGVSGQCYMSALIGSRSANRGLCAQACRLPFTSNNDEERRALSLKDLSLIESINELVECGVSSIKIEGRMKRPEYVAAAVTACRTALFNNLPDMDTLRSVFSRSGFTDGYFKAKIDGDMFGVRGKDDVVSARDVLPQLAELYRKEGKATTLDFDVYIGRDKPTQLIAKDGDGNSVTVEGECPQEALKRPTTLEDVEKQLSKLGDTVYSAGEIRAEIEDGLMLPASKFNSLRREACEKLDEIRIARNTPSYLVREEQEKSCVHQPANQPEIRIYVERISQLEEVDTQSIQLIMMNSSEIANNFDELLNVDAGILEKIAVVPPRFITDERALLSELQRIKDLGISRIICTNMAYIKIARELDMKAHGDFGLNVANTLSTISIAELGVEDVTLSFEMKFSQMIGFKSALPFGIIAYGRLPMMLMRNCPIKAEIGCASCERKIKDRTGREMPVRCSGDYIEILNSEVLYLADRMREIPLCDFITLIFREESSEKVVDIIESYKNGTKNNGQVTRGLYYRGVN